MRHVVWDWNGTLFDDHHLVVDGLNAVLDDVGIPRVDIATYQRLYTRPVQVFYERVFGRAIAAEEWQHVDDVFHDAYAAALARAGLASDAEVSLDHVAGTGTAQSLLSMYRHDDLVPLVTRFGIADRFARIDGVRGGGGGTKAPYLQAHLDRVIADPATDADDVLVIGDAVDDAAAATDVGARCILYDGGAHPRGQLEATGYPVASTLTQALEIAGLS